MAPDIRTKPMIFTWSFGLSDQKFTKPKPPNLPNSLQFRFFAYSPSPSRSTESSSDGSGEVFPSTV